MIYVQLRDGQFVSCSEHVTMLETKSGDIVVCCNSIAEINKAIETGKQFQKQHSNQEWHQIIDTVSEKVFKGLHNICPIKTEALDKLRAHVEELKSKNGNNPKK